MKVKFLFHNKFYKLFYIVWKWFEIDILLTIYNTHIWINKKYLKTATIMKILSIMNNLT